MQDQLENVQHLQSACAADPSLQHNFCNAAFRAADPSLQHNFCSAVFRAADPSLQHNFGSAALRVADPSKSDRAVAAFGDMQSLFKREREREHVTCKRAREMQVKPRQDQIACCILPREDYVCVLCVVWKSLHMCVCVVVWKSLHFHILGRENLGSDTRDVWLQCGRQDLEKRGKGRRQACKMRRNQQKQFSECWCREVFVYSRCALSRRLQKYWKKAT